MGRKKGKGSRCSSAKKTIPRPENVISSSSEVAAASDDGSQIGPPGTENLIGSSSEVVASDGGSQTGQPERKLVLTCQHPNDDRRVVFDIERGQNDSRHKIVNAETSQQVYSVAMSGLGGLGGADKYSMDCFKYEYTLETFLCRTKVEIINGLEVEKEIPKFSTELGIVHILDQSVNDVVRGILFEVCQIHKSKNYHGSLDKLSNIVIKKEYKPNGIFFKVSLVHKERTNSPAIVSKLSGMMKDFKDISDVIFHKILPQEIATLTHWDDLQKYLNNFYRYSLDPKFLPFDYAATWGFNRRLEFYEILYIESKKRVDIETAINKLTSFRNWNTAIKVGTVLHRVYKNKTNSYHVSPMGLLHFLRVVVFHIHDTAKPGTPYYDVNIEPNWKHECYLEFEINKLWPTFIAHIIHQLLRDKVDTGIIRIRE